MAALRLERLGYQSVFDYEFGKLDWIGSGLAVERSPHRSQAAKETS
jgi:hypothetical protein